MLIFRYLAKEVYLTLISLTLILSLVFMSNQFVHYLNRAVSGQIPVVFVMKLMLLELPNLMGLLLPLGFYVAILMAYGRLYSENEMTILRASGYGETTLLKHTLLMASIIALFVGLIMLWGSPHIATERAKILRSSGMQTLIKTIAPGRFRELSSGRQVFYVDKMNHSHTKASDIFLARLNEKEGQSRWDVMWADKAFIEQHPETGEEQVVLQSGKAYQGVPGQADYQMASFDTYYQRLPQPVVAVKNDIRTAATKTLWKNRTGDIKNWTELQWRLSIPLMVFCLTMVAVPLSRVHPRAGKYAKLFPAMLIYMFYANFMFVIRDWMMANKLPPWIGFWWLHLTIALLGGLLIWRSQKRGM